MTNFPMIREPMWGTRYHGHWCQHADGIQAASGRQVSSQTPQQPVPKLSSGASNVHLRKLPHAMPQTNKLIVSLMLLRNTL